MLREDIFLQFILFTISLVLFFFLFYTVVEVMLDKGAFIYNHTSEGVGGLGFCVKSKIKKGGWFILLLGEKNYSLI